MNVRKFAVAGLWVAGIQIAAAAPDFIYRKDRLPDLIVEQKKEHRYFTLLPAIAVDPETGFNFGAISEIFDNKTKEDPFFAYTPYRQRIQVAAITSTERWTQLLATYDQPYFKDSPWRLRGLAQFIRNPIQTYFGLGNASLAPLHFPGSPNDFSNYDDYKNALKLESGGTAYTKYTEYSQKTFTLGPSVEYDLLGGILRPLGGFQVNYYWIDDYSGEYVDAVDAAGHGVPAIQAPTKLAEDCAAGIATGCNGGWDNFFKIGLTLDTRDFEPDPNEGFYLQFVGEFATPALGSNYTYERLNFSFAGYQDILPGSKRLVVAGRFLYSMQFGDVPFFSVPTLAYTDRDWSGLGGFRSMRGFVSNRFVGPAAALTNWEFRWLVGEAKPFDQYLRFTLAPFWDAGRVFDDVQSTTLHGWKNAGGLGFRLAWNLATVVLFDYGFSSEGSAFYMELGHTF